MSTLRTEAWLLLGLVSSLPGELILRDGTLSFVAHGTGSAWPGQLRRLGQLLGAPQVAQQIEDGQRPTLFRWPVEELAIHAPWHYFGGGLKIRRNATQLRISFGRPANTRAGVRAATILDAADNLREVTVMRRRGRAWLDAIERARQARARA